MSTYVGYHCDTCDMHSPNWLNHGDDLLLTILAQRDLFEHLFDLFQTTILGQWMHIEILGVYDFPGPAEWLWDHRGHAVVVEDEYGDRYEPKVQAA